MKTPRKVVVSKKVSDTQILNSIRWEEFVKNCQIPWEELRDEWKDFYASMGDTKSSAEDITKAIDHAMKGDSK